jgi:hypothetical protein
MKLSLLYKGYKDEGFAKIMTYLSEKGEGQQLIKLDEDNPMDEIDLIFDTLKISGLSIEEDKDNKYNINISFYCTYKVAKYYLKFIYSLKTLGDGGHSYTVNINGKHLFWDGDGADRIVKINGKDCSSVKTLYKDYSQYLQKEDEIAEQYFIEGKERIL